MYSCSMLLVSMILYKVLVVVCAGISFRSLGSKSRGERDLWKWYLYMTLSLSETQ